MNDNRQNTSHFKIWQYKYNREVQRFVVQNRFYHSPFKTTNLVAIPIEFDRFYLRVSSAQIVLNFLQPYKTRLIIGTLD